MPRVDFHTHSTCSDGSLEPERLAVWLASQGARYAALTDHDTIAGCARFRAALTRHGVACLDGVEMTARSSLGEVHILAYSAIPFGPDVTALLPPQMAGKWGAGLAGMAEMPGRNGHPAVPDATTLLASLRKAGAATFLAHPYTVTRDHALLGALLHELKQAGLDGIEAIYGAYSGAETDALLEMASNHGLATSAGSDLHEPGSNGPQGVVAMDEGQWRSFRNSIFGHSVIETGKVETSNQGGKKPAKKIPAVRMAFGVRVAFPALAVVALFVVSMFAILLPHVHSMLLDHKKETIREISESVVSILAEYEREIEAGLADPVEAKLEAAARVRDLRYGPQNKDYLWITDSLPRMVMHPYRPELNGQDLRNFTDEAGLPVFVEFVRAASDMEGGYVEYLWQWEDEADRVVPKLSYVLRFAPWDWVLGTGVYLEDINEEMARLTREIVLAVAGITAILAFLLSFMVQNSLAAERARLLAENAMRESRERYRILVEASREGMAMVMDGAFTFANTALLELTGYSEHEFLLLSVVDVLNPFPDGTEESTLFLASLTSGTPPSDSPVPGSPLPGSPVMVLPLPFSSSLACKAGTRIEVTVSAAGFGLGGREGVMLAIRQKGDYGNDECEGASEFPDSQSAEVLESFAGRWNGQAAAFEASRLAMLEPVSSVSSVPIVCAPGDTVQSVASSMATADAIVALVVDEAGRSLGSVSGHELSHRVLSGNLDASIPVFRVMSAPLELMQETASIAAAHAVLTRSGRDWTALQHPDGTVRSIVLRQDMPALGLDGLSAVLAAMADAQSPAELAAARKSILGNLRTMMHAGAKARLVVNLLTDVHDALVRRLIALANGTRSEPPCPWAFVALGSAGRGEMLPDSDQDNALVFDPVDGDGQKEKAWFLSLGAYVCDGLEAAGIPACRHGLMARNAEWCLTRTEWEARYTRWVAEPEPDRIVNLNALIDIRAVAGHTELVLGLRTYFKRAVAATPAFLLHLANGARNLRIPNLAASSGTPSHESGTIAARSAAMTASKAAAKEAAGLFPAFARVYATRAGLSETATHDRLNALAAKGDLWEDTARDSAEAYEALLSARLQLYMIPSTNRGRIAEAVLKATLSQAAVLQKRIGFDFLGQQS